jgi:hypothetical protein
MKELLAEKGHFSLRKYYKSYEKIEKKFTCSEEGNKLEGSIDDSQFIIFTNADVVQEQKSDFSQARFLMTGGPVLHFNEEEHPAIYQHLQDLPKLHEFLRRFIICYSQPDEKKMDWFIKCALQRSMNLPGSELDINHSCFLKVMKKWWENENYYLQETNSTEKDPLQKILEKVAKKLDQMKSELGEPSIKRRKADKPTGLF